ncbi:MAG: protoporphyrinogen oxidase HemJ [Rhodospirillaceae bacterium]|nr:protoporphyrinogen oxidase HemJ [Rhodospirillaceae bacterium]
MLEGDGFLWVRALHIIAVIAWMAGLLYLPRLYVYHCQVTRGSQASELFKVMERRLLRAIMNPAMIVSWGLGLWMYASMEAWTEGWMHVKLAALVGLTVAHAMMARWRKEFETDSNARPETFYRIANEVPTALMIVIVIMVVVKPF